jgi:hypothetical protein
MRQPRRLFAGAGARGPCAWGRLAVKHQTFAHSTTHSTPMAPYPGLHQCLCPEEPLFSGQLWLQRRRRRRCGAELRQRNGRLRCRLPLWHAAAAMRPLARCQLHQAVPGVHQRLCRGNPGAGRRWRRGRGRGGAAAAADEGAARGAMRQHHCAGRAAGGGHLEAVGWDGWPAVPLQRWDLCPGCMGPALLGQ